MRHQLLDAISAEVDRAQSLYPRFNSNHEGYAVLLEEVDEARDSAEHQVGHMVFVRDRCPMCELWKLIKADKGIRCTEYMKHECIQIAAMAIRFVEDLSRE